MGRGRGKRDRMGREGMKTGAKTGGDRRLKKNRDPKAYDPRYELCTDCQRRNQDRPFPFASGAVSQCTAIWGKNHEYCLCRNDVPNNQCSQTRFAGTKTKSDLASGLPNTCQIEALHCDAPPTPTSTPCTRTLISHQFPPLMSPGSPRPSAPYRQPPNSQSPPSHSRPGRLEMPAPLR